MPRNVKLRSPEFLDNQAAARLTEILLKDLSSRDLGVYLCLHLGLTAAEASALKVSCIDFSHRTLTICQALMRIRKGKEVTARLVDVEERVLPLPHYVYRILCRAEKRFVSPEDLLVFEPRETRDPRKIAYRLNAINRVHHIAGELAPAHLQATFIRHALENGVDYVTLGRYLGIRARELFDRYSGEMEGSLSAMERVSDYGARLEGLWGENRIRRMNLLILGAGSCGCGVYDTAKAIGVFERIDFLDDNPDVDAAGRWEEFQRFSEEYPLMFPAMGDNVLRMEWIRRLERSGVIVPKLIAPSGYVSPSAVVGSGSIVMARAAVGAEAVIAPGCLLEAGCTVGSGAKLGEGVRIGCGAAVPEETVVAAMAAVESGGAGQKAVYGLHESAADEGEMATS